MAHAIVMQKKLTFALPAVCDRGRGIGSDFWLTLVLRTANTGPPPRVLHTEGMRFEIVHFLYTLHVFLNSACMHYTQSDCRHIERERERESE